MEFFICMCVCIYCWYKKVFNDIKNEEFKVFKMFVKDLLKDILYCDKILFGIFVIVEDGIKSWNNL